AAEQRGKQHPGVREVLAHPLVPDEPAVVPLHLDRVLDGAREAPIRRTGADGRGERHQPPHRRVLHDDAAREHEQDGEANEEPPPRFDPRFLPQHGYASSAWTVSRKMSFNVTGVTSIATGCSAWASATSA